MLCLEIDQTKPVYIYHPVQNPLLGDFLYELRFFRDDPLPFQMSLLCQIRNGDVGAELLKGLSLAQSFRHGGKNAVRMEFLKKNRPAVIAPGVKIKLSKGGESGKLKLHTILPADYKIASPCYLLRQKIKTKEEPPAIKFLQEHADILELSA